MGLAVASAEEARWIRYPAISPDGSRIAFSFRGDLWLVPVDGGEARPLTSHVAYECAPVWSPDGKSIVFASDRHGNFDLFVVPAAGGPSRRLTYHSSSDVPCCFSRDGTRVYFSATRLDAPEAALAGVWLPELYSISVEGGQPRRELTTPALSAQLSPDGRLLAYEDLKGYENAWRKHHVSSIARDLWTVDLESGHHVKRTTFRGEDRDPVWSPDGATLYYLSEQGGSFNVWALPLAGGEPRALTHHGPHPARFLSGAADGTLCYTVNGELFVLRPGQEPRPLRVTVTAGERTNARTREVLRRGATEFAVAPNEEEVAFVVRGEVFVASIAHGTTRRVTETPEQERSVAWAPDGRTLYYAGERGGSWNLYATTLARPQEKHFFNASLLEEKPLLVSTDETFQPVVSPDGKQIAYLRNRDEIRVLDVATGASRTVVPADRNYSYADGDVVYAWSPDGRWLACSILTQGRWLENIGVVDLATGQLVDMTQSGYSEVQPAWSADSRSLLFVSNRYGRRNHGSWGSDADVMALDLTRAARDRARLTEEEFELLEGKKKKDRRGRKDKDKGEAKEGGGDDEEGKEEKEKKPPEPVVIEFEGREDRVRRLTQFSSPMGAYALSPDGETIVYWASVDGNWDLWLNEIRKGSTRRLAKLGEDRGCEVVFAGDGEAVFARTAKGRIAKVKLGGDTEDVAYAAEMEVDAPAERAYIFEHAWRQAKEKFYDANLHGADWDGLKANYEPLLAQIDNNQDFAELLSEMLGELNASHTGARYRVPDEGADETAALGLLFDGDSFVVAEVLRDGPVDKAGSKIAPGVELIGVDSTALLPLGLGVNLAALLNGRKDKPTLLTCKALDGTLFEETVKPISLGEERELMYRRWTRSRRALVERLGGGRIGYVHVRGMNDPSFRTVYQEVLGRDGGKEALVVDTRFNGGGNLHDDLVQFLGGREYAIFQPRGKERGSLGGEPGDRWYRPVVVVQGEGNYSDAHIFPYAFKELGLGQLVGAPVAGTGTAVWWERQIDPTLVFGIPQVGFVTPEGKYLENNELWPDVEVYNDPESVAKGEDRQLAKAVEVLLAQLK